MCEIKHIDFYAGDWISGTASLSLEERGLFITACALIYGNGGPVERDRLHRACGVHGRTFNAILGRLLALGKLYEEAGKIGQKRAENELKKARKRLEKWAKNLDNPTKPNGYDDRAEGNARASLATIRDSKKDLSQPSLSPSPARATHAHTREGPAAPAAPSRQAGNLKICEEWIAEAEAERSRSDLPPVDMHDEARELEKIWLKDPPRCPHAAWLGRARKARPKPLPHRPFYVEPPPGPPPPFDLREALAELGCDEAEIESIVAETAAREAAHARIAA